MNYGKGPERFSALFKRQPALKLLGPQVAVKCHGCGSTIMIDGARYELPSPLGVQHISLTPCLKAPYICDFCRTLPAKLAAARRAMETHFEAEGRECERAA